MRLNKKTLRAWGLKIIVILIVLFMIFTGFSVVLWK